MQGMASSKHDINLTDISAKAVTAWLMHDPDGSRAALKAPLVGALNLPPGSVPDDIVPDANAPQHVAHEEHILKVIVLT